MANRWKKGILASFFVLVVFVAVGITATIGWRPIIGPKTRALTDRRFDPTPDRLQRGEYVVRSVAGCLFCHSQIDTAEQGLPVKSGMAGAGRTIEAEGMPWLTAPNLTPDRDTGAGTWTDDMMARGIREGIGHDGRALFPFMPYQNYRHMSDEDLASVVTYIRSLSPIRHDNPKTSIPFPVGRLINAVPQPIEGTVDQPDLSTPVGRGQYLVTLASCGDCHTPRDEQGQYLPGMELAGGNIVEFKDARPGRAAANLTPAPNGIPYYDEDLFVEVIRTGRVRDRQISDVMPWGHYRGMSDEDLRAIFAYLKTVPSVDHYVDNAMPPTACAKCKIAHGGGERNKRTDD